MSKSRMSPSQLMLNAYYVLRKTSQTEPLFLTNSDGTAVAFIFQIGDQFYSLFSPCSDDTNYTAKSRNHGTRSLNTVLGFAQQIQAANPHISLTAFIPLAQCKKKEHWVLLAIEKNTPQIYDPQPSLSFLEYFASLLPSALIYDFTAIKNILIEEKFLHLNKINYLGIQSKFDNIHCGHSVVYTINCLAQQKSLVELINTAPNFQQHANDYAAIFKEEFGREYLILADGLDIYDTSKVNYQRTIPNLENRKVISEPITIIERAPIYKNDMLSFTLQTSVVTVATSISPPKTVITSDNPLTDSVQEDYCKSCKPSY